MDTEQLIRTSLTKIKQGRRQMVSGGLHRSLMVATILQRAQLMEPDDDETAVGEPSPPPQLQCPADVQVCAMVTDDCVQADELPADQTAAEQLLCQQEEDEQLSARKRRRLSVGQRERPVDNWTERGKRRRVVPCVTDTAAGIVCSVDQVTNDQDEGISDMHVDAITDLVSSFKLQQPRAAGQLQPPAHQRHLLSPASWSRPVH